MNFISYAQNFEDVMLWRALKNIKNGLYIDIGAQHPETDSVSKGFYEKGWRGIHVEATTNYANLLRQDRPDETVIQAAVNDVKGVITFYDIRDTGLSTGDSEIAQYHRTSGYTVLETLVPCITLAEVLEQAGQRSVHWLKIDVEGMEKKVLTSWEGSSVRPWIIAIESTYPNSQNETHQSWENLILERGYLNVYFDGLSRYYVSSEHLELTKYFSKPPNIFDDFGLALSSPYCSVSRKQIEKIEQHHLEEYNKLKERIEEQLEFNNFKNLNLQKIIYKKLVNLENKFSNYKLEEKKNNYIIKNLQYKIELHNKSEKVKFKIINELRENNFSNSQLHLKLMVKREQDFNDKIKSEREIFNKINSIQNEQIKSLINKEHSLISNYIELIDKINKENVIIREYYEKKEQEFLLTIKKLDESHKVEIKNFVEKINFYKNRELNLKEELKNLEKKTLLKISTLNNKNNDRSKLYGQQLLEIQKNSVRIANQLKIEINSNHNEIKNNLLEKIYTYENENKLNELKYLKLFNDLQDIYNSRSWKIMTPFRWVLKNFKK